MVISILLVEDELMWQAGIAALLAMEDDFDLVAVTDNADDGEKLFAEHQPQIVLVDWKIKGRRDGLELAAALPTAPQNIIIITGSPEEQLPDIPYGYVSKAEMADNLIPAIRQAQQCSL